MHLILAVFLCAQVGPPPESQPVYEAEADLLPHIEPGIISFGVPKEMGRKHPHIIVDGERLNWDDKDGWYHFADGQPHPSGKNLNRAFLLLGDKDIVVGKSDWEDPATKQLWERTPKTGEWVKTDRKRPALPVVAPEPPPATKVHPDDVIVSVPALKGPSLTERLHAVAQSHRERSGLPRQELDPNLNAISQRWAERMASENSMYHGGGENIVAYGTSTPEATIQMWINSPGHRAFVLGGNQRAGWGAARAKNGTWYWAGAFRNHPVAKAAHAGTMVGKAVARTVSAPVRFARNRIGRRR